MQTQAGACTSGKRVTVCACVCTYVCVRACACTYVCARACACVYAFIVRACAERVRACMFVCLRVTEGICACIYITVGVVYECLYVFTRRLYQDLDSPQRRECGIS